MTRREEIWLYVFFGAAFVALLALFRVAGCQ